jgi:hypothetical protein
MEFLLDVKDALQFVGYYTGQLMSSKLYKMKRGTFWSQSKRQPSKREDCQTLCIGFVLS